MALRQGGEGTQLQGIVLLIDLQGVSWRNLDPRISRALFAASRANKIVGRVTNFLFVNPPFIFNLLFPVIKPFFGDRMVVLGAGAAANAALLEYIDCDQLLPEYGGTLQYNHEAWCHSRKDDAWKAAQAAQRASMTAIGGRLPYGALSSSIVPALPSFHACATDAGAALSAAATTGAICSSGKTGNGSSDEAAAPASVSDTMVASPSVRIDDA